MKAAVFPDQCDSMISMISMISILRRRSLVVITNAQLHSTRLELMFCAGSNPGRSVLVFRDGEDL